MFSFNLNIRRVFSIFYAKKKRYLSIPLFSVLLFYIYLVFTNSMPDQICNQCKNSDHKQYRKCNRHQSCYCCHNQNNRKHHNGEYNLRCSPCRPDGKPEHTSDKPDDKRNKKYGKHLLFFLRTSRPVPLPQHLPPQRR